MVEIKKEVKMEVKEEIKEEIKEEPEMHPEGGNQEEEGMEVEDTPEQVDGKILINYIKDIEGRVKHFHFIKINFDFYIKALSTNYKLVFTEFKNII